MAFLKKAWHWLMIGCMVSMVAMAGHMALIAQGANTSFLSVAGSYISHIWSGLTNSIGPAIKAFGVAGQNLLANVGFMDPVSTTGALAAAPPPMPGAHEAMGHVMNHTASQAATMSKLAAVAPPPLTDTFMAQFQSFAPDLQEQFRQTAQRFGLSLQDVVAGYCDPLSFNR